jgi:hypothetical protein
VGTSRWSRFAGWRRSTRASALVALGAGLALAGASVFHSTAVHAAASRPTVLDGFMSAVQRPTAGEFPTEAAAIDFFVESVRTQDLADVTKVLPVADLFQKASFSSYVGLLRSIDLQGIFPGQPLSKLAYLIGTMSVYTRFTTELLLPGFDTSGTMPLETKAAQNAIAARLDPSRLSGISVRSVKVTQVVSAAKFGLTPLGITEQAVATAVIAGIGSPRSFEFILDRIGGNWQVTSFDKP